MAYQDARGIQQAIASAVRRDATWPSGEASRAFNVWVMQRLIVRLAGDAEQRWVLKGGQAMLVRLPSSPRLTADVDGVFAAQSVDDAMRHFVELISQPTPQADHLRFTCLQHHARGPERTLVRAQVGFETLMGNRWHEHRPFKVEFVVQPTFDFDPELRELTPRLGLKHFDDWPDQLAMFPADYQAAEKLAAYYTEHDGVMSSRSRDVIDLALLATYERPDPADITRHLEKVLARPHYDSTTIRLPEEFQVRDNTVKAYHDLAGLPAWDEARKHIAAIVGPALAAHASPTLSADQLVQRARQLGKRLAGRPTTSPPEPPGPLPPSVRPPAPRR